MLLIVCSIIVIFLLRARAMDPDLKLLGLRIRELRKAKGLSQEDLADRCGLHRTYIGGVERGERNLGVLNLIGIARALEVEPAGLLDLVPDARTEPESAKDRRQVEPS